MLLILYNDLMYSAKVGIFLTTVQFYSLHHGLTLLRQALRIRSQWTDFFPSIVLLSSVHLWSHWKLNLIPSGCAVSACIFLHKVSIQWFTRLTSIDSRAGQLPDKKY